MGPWAIDKNFEEAQPVLGFQNRSTGLDSLGTEYKLDQYRMIKIWMNVKWPILHEPTYSLS